MHETPITVGVVGLGYVGLPLVVSFAEAGADVIAIDSDITKVQALCRAESYIEDVASAALRAMRGRIHPTTSTPSWRTPTRSSSASRRR